MRCYWRMGANGEPHSHYTYTLSYHFGGDDLLASTPLTLFLSNMHAQCLNTFAFGRTNQHDNRVAVSNTSAVTIAELDSRQFVLPIAPYLPLFPAAHK